MQDLASELLRTPLRRSSAQPRSDRPEFLEKSQRSKSQPLVTIPRHGCGYHARAGAEIVLLAGPIRRGPLESGGACYGELPRIPLPRTRVNKGKKKGRGVAASALLVIRCVSLLARQLLPGFIHQPLLFLLLPFCCSGFLFLPRLGDGAYLLHHAKGIVAGPALRELG